MGISLRKMRVLSSNRIWIATSLIHIKIALQTSKEKSILVYVKDALTVVFVTANLTPDLAMKFFDYIFTQLETHS
jgi:hypothetical protein